MIYDKLPVVFLSTMASEKKDSTNKIIAEYILSHQDEIRNISIKELADACHVGTGSLSRFVRDIGLNDFAELRMLLGDTFYRFEKAETETDLAEDQGRFISRSVVQALSSIDMKTVEMLAKDMHDYKKVYVCGMLKAQNAAVDLSVDMCMLGKLISTNTAYADQIDHIIKAGKEDLIIVFSYTGSYFDYQDFRAREKHLILPKIWMICGTQKEMPWFIDHVIRFDSTGSQRSHPFQLEAAESLIVQTYARMYAE